MFLIHEFLFAHANAMFTGTSAPQGKRAFCHAIGQALGDANVIRLVRIDQQKCMEIAITDMAQHWAAQSALCNVIAGFTDCLGKVCDRYADIGDQRTRTRLRRKDRVMRVVAHGPKNFAVIWF